MTKYKKADLVTFQFSMSMNELYAYIDALKLGPVEERLKWFYLTYPYEYAHWSPDDLGSFLNISREEIYRIKKKWNTTAHDGSGSIILPHPSKKFQE
jgi:hypothetical protein